MIIVTSTNKTAHILDISKKCLQTRNMFLFISSILGSTNNIYVAYK
jgi:hypothetical protein